MTYLMRVGVRGREVDLNHSPTVSPLIELARASQKKNERAARQETKRLVYEPKVLGQPVTSELRPKRPKNDQIPFSPTISLQMALAQNFNV